MGLPELKAAYDALPKEKKQSAIEYLKYAIPTADQVRMKEMIKENRECWFAGLHFSTGMTVRNLLRSAGFGEAYFGIENMDDIYVELLEDTVNGHSG